MKAFRQVQLLAAAALLWGSVSNANAGVVFSSLNEIQFENRENEINSAEGTQGNLDIADRLVGILRVNEITVGGVSQDPVVPEVTGVFDLEVFAVIVKGSPDGPTFTSQGAWETHRDAGTGFTGETFVLFRPTNKTGGVAEGLLGGFAAGTAMALYEGGDSLLDSLNTASNTVSDDIAAASDGSFLGSLGFGSAAFDSVDDWGAEGNGYWYATVAFEDGVASAVTEFFYGLTALDGPLADAGEPIGLFNKQLPTSIDIPEGTDIARNRGLTEFIPLGTPATTAPVTFDLVGRGNTSVNTKPDRFTVTEEATTDRWVIFSNDPAQVFPTPEPSSLALLAMGALSGVPYVRRRLKRRERSQTA